MPLPERYSVIWNICKTLVKKFLDDRCPTLASALSFSSMLSIVPFLAIVFAVLKALDVYNAMTPLLLTSLVGVSQEIVVRILRYINNTHVGSMGLIGLIALLITVITTLVTVEEAFNQICGIERGKSVHHKLIDYLIVIFGIPVLIGLAVALSTSLQNQSVVQWFLNLPVIGNLLLLRLVPYLSIWIALVCLYKFIPNVKIDFRNALVGGLIVGTAWQMVQWAFIHFQLGVTRQNAIYGTLSLLPVFMLWVYTCWILILAGMVIIWQLQNKTADAIAPATGADGDDRDQRQAQQGLPRD